MGPVSHPDRRLLLTLRPGARTVLLRPVPLEPALDLEAPREGSEWRRRALLDEASVAEHERLDVALLRGAEQEDDLGHDHRGIDFWT